MGVKLAERARLTFSHCLMAEIEYLRALRRIRERTDPEDTSVREFLGDLVVLAADQERIVALTDLPVSVAYACPVPKLKVDIGEGWLDRDVALYFVERITSEMASFYRATWEAAPEGRRDSLREMAEMREIWIERFKTVIL